MVIQLNISAETEAKLKARAAAAGVDVATYAARYLDWMAGGSSSFTELVGEGVDTGMTEDELGGFLEEEKHTMRAEKRAKRLP